MRLGKRVEESRLRRRGMKGEEDAFPLHPPPGLRPEFPLLLPLEVLFIKFPFMSGIGGAGGGRFTYGGKGVRSARHRT